MGTYLSRNEEEISQSLRQQYEVQAQPYLKHKRTQEICLLHKITTSSDPQANKIRLVIQEYSQSKCQSINKLRTHYFVDNTGYCSDQQNFYLVFDGQNNYSLREQFAKRRLYRLRFKDEQIEQIIETFLCGFREYDHRFKREFNQLSLDCIAIDKKSKKIYLKDPWLITTHSNDHHDPITSLLLNYPSPQKLRSAFVNKLQDYQDFLSNLFSIGVMALQLNRLQFADGIYARKKEVNYEEIRLRLNQFHSPRLKRGIQCLLNIEPSQRKRIFQIWGIENNENHYLQPITIRQQKNSSKFSRVQTNQHSKFRFPSPSNTNHQPIQPSIVFNNQPFYNETFTTVELPRRGNSQPRPFQASTPPVNHYTRRSPHEFIQEIQARPQSRPLQIQVMNFAIEPQKLPSFNDFLRSQERNSAFNKNMYSQPIHSTIVNSSLSSPFENNDFNTIKVGQSQNKKSQTVQSESYQTRIQSPIKERQINSIVIDTIYENPMKLQRSSSLIQKLHNMEHSQQKGIQSALIVHNQQPNNHTKLKQMHESVAQVFKQPIKQDHEEKQNHQQNLTPQRPIIRTQHNSTIVQVRDEDTPDHSRESVDQTEQMEYVVEQYESGSKYEGFKSKGMRNGKGKFYYQDGGFYEGEWKDNKMDGYGKLYYEGGKIAYEGYWLQDQFNGMGKVYNDNPIKLKQGFDYSNFDFLEDYWEYYEGMLIHDTKQGRGKIKLSNGQIFQGDFHSDRIHGFGKFRSMNGNLVEGIWRDSKLIKVITSSSS